MAMTPEEPDKSAFADNPFSGDDPDLNDSENLFDKMDTSSINQRQEGVSQMVSDLLDRLGD